MFPFGFVCFGELTIPQKGILFSFKVNYFVEKGYSIAIAKRFRSSFVLPKATQKNRPLVLPNLSSYLPLQDQNLYNPGFFPILPCVRAQGVPHLK